MCGDYSFLRTISHLSQGSPPPVRGLRYLLGYMDNRCRITPARAGTTDKFLINDFSYRDHPRPCGDYAADKVKISPMGGSPPPVRGLLFCLFASGFIHRITPARAGTTLKRSRNYLIFIIRYPIIYSLYELIFLPELHLQELCEELLHQCHRILKQFPACSYSKISYLFLQTA